MGALVARWWAAEHGGGEVSGRDGDGDGDCVTVVGAGRVGAAAVGAGDGRDDIAPVVLGLPRGGVPVAAEVAAALVADGVDASLDVLLVRKVGVPGHPELAMAAVGEGGVVVNNADVLTYSAVSPIDYADAVRREQLAMSQRAERYRMVRASAPLSGRVVVIVDDGIATGATARAACAVARARGAALIVLASPVIAPSTAAELTAGRPTPADGSDTDGSGDGVARGRGPDADVLLALLVPEQFAAVGQFYADFSPTSDREVERILRA